MASLVFLLFLLYEAASETEVKVGPEELGKNVTLQCNASNINIKAVEWTRSDLVDPEYVLYYSNGHYDKTFQHSSFKGRVQLVDGDLKNGNVSLILKNVSREDVGTYECRVVTAGSRRKKRALRTEPISTVQLQVTEDQNGDTNGPNTNGPNNNGANNNGANNNISTPLRVGLGAAAGVLFCLAVGLFLFSKSKRQRDKKPEPSAGEETGGENLL
ncbi:programmed cell death 1 ligand 1-like [Pagrus major]|uniref:programmed cell death 1 ligand 1-like n=1 Tax=Pagrus major TaxID=143350 RepID=UPI003CC865F4